MSERWLTCIVNSSSQLPVLLCCHILAVGCTDAHPPITPRQFKVTVGRPEKHPFNTNLMRSPRQKSFHRVWISFEGYLVEAVHCSPPVTVRVQYFPAAVLKAHFLSSRLISNWKTSWSPSSSWLADRSMPKKLACSHTSLATGSYNRNGISVDKDLSTNVTWWIILQSFIFMWCAVCLVMRRNKIAKQI